MTNDADPAMDRLGKAMIAIGREMSCISFLTNFNKAVI